MPENLLNIFAEVAISITAFSGIVVVLVGRDDIAWLKTQAVTVKAMLETSLTVVIFSLLALSLGLLSDDPFYGIPLLTGLFGAWHLFILIIALKRRHFIWPGWTIGFVTFGALVLVAAQFILPIMGATKYLWGIYILGLFWLLVMSIMNFCLLLYAWFQTRNEEEISSDN